MGQEGITIGDQITSIKAESSSATSSLHLGQISPVATQQKTKKDVNRSNRSYLLDTVIDYRDDISESIYFEAFVQHHTSNFLRVVRTIEHSIPTDKLVFPFHFFL